MADISIDRLILHASGLSESQGRRLAAQIAIELAQAPGIPGIGDIPRLEVSLPLTHSAAMPDLVQRIADAALRQLRASA
jgi:hypothetical protein